MSAILSATLPPEGVMKKLGTVQDLSFRGDLLVRASFAPSPDARVLDARGRPLGHVKRVFGPVAAPYLAVKPVRETNLRLIGSPVYVEE